MLCLTESDLGEFEGHVFQFLFFLFIRGLYSLLSVLCVAEVVVQTGTVRIHQSPFSRFFDRWEESLEETVAEVTFICGFHGQALARVSEAAVLVERGLQAAHVVVYRFALLLSAGIDF